MSEELCQFAQLADGRWKCPACGYESLRPSAKPPIARCQARPPSPSRSAACVHRGAELRLADCETCSGRVQLKVFACALHGECTLAKQLDGIACCRPCFDYQPPAVSPESATDSPSDH